MSFHPSKCKVLRLTRSKSPITFTYYMSDIALSTVSSMNDLGVLAQSDLLWNSHIVNIVKKANSMIGFIIRTVGFDSSQEVRKALYVSLVRSVLEYGCPGWSPLSRHHMCLLEGVQRRATKFILRANDNVNAGDLDYRDRLLCLNMLPLSYRREIADIMLFVKSLANMNDLDLSNYVSFSARPTRSSRSFMLMPCRCKTSTFAMSYFPRLVTEWNKLDVTVRNIGAVSSHQSDLLSFKQLLVKSTVDRFRSHFVSDNLCTWSTACKCASCQDLRAR